ncbi:hypothetical protein C3L33_05936, partial [Rhododendron williamsianum]
MGAEAAAEQTPAESTPENVDALLEWLLTASLVNLGNGCWTNKLEFFLIAFLQAARYGDIEDVISLASSGVFLDSKDSQGRTALHMASANGHLDIVDYLITNGVQDVNAPNVEKNTPLHWACLNGHIEVVKNLILAGASVSAINSHERTPMDEAVSRGKMDIIDAIGAAVAQVELSGTRVS